MSTNALTRKQRLSVILSEARVNIWEGAVRSSKTICSILRWIKYIKNAPAGPLLMVGKTERTLKRNIIDVMIAMLGPKRARYIAGAGEFWVLNRLIYVVGANDESANEKIRGMTCAGAYGDEVSIWPESFFSMLLSRLSVAGAKFFGTTNPDNPVHWLKKQLDRVAIHLTRDGEVKTRRIGDDTRFGTVLNWARLTFKLRDNPNLPEEYLRSLESEYTGLWYRRFILGEWVAAEGAVYEMWDPDLMMVDKLPPIKRILSDGIDYGTTNPTAGIRIGLGVDGCLYAMAEWSPRRGMTDVELALDYKAWQNEQGKLAEYSIVDPAAKSLRQEFRRSAVHPSIRAANNDVEDGIRTVAALFGGSKYMPRLFIHTSCENLLDEIPGYSWDPKQSDKGVDKVIKQADHYCDGLRYALYTIKPGWERLIRDPIPKEVAA